MPMVKVEITLQPDEYREDSIVVTTTQAGPTDEIVEAATADAVKQVIAAAHTTRDD